MSAEHGSRALLTGSRSLVDGLARSVISKVNATPHQRRYRRVEIGTNVLYAAVLDKDRFDSDTVKADLGMLRISMTDIVDQCIPKVAAMLGEDWVADRLSFARVTVASARLFSLCKSVGQEWDNVRTGIGSHAVLLATIDREDHIIGPAVLADQLRRRGHSVQLHSNATAQSLREKLSQDSFDGVLVSVATRHGLELARKAITELKKGGVDTIVALGGAVLNEDGINVQNTGADVTTNDLDEALDVMAGNDVEVKVAE